MLLRPSQQQPHLIIPVPPKIAFTYDIDNAPIEDTDPLITPKANHEHIPLIEYIVGAGIKYVFNPKTRGYNVIGPVDHVPKQGWYIFHIGRKYPQPGFPSPFSLAASEGPKRHLLHWIECLMTKEMLPFIFV